MIKPSQIPMAFPKPRIDAQSSAVESCVYNARTFCGPIFVTPSTSPQDIGYVYLASGNIYLRSRYCAIPNAISFGSKEVYLTYPLTFLALSAFLAFSPFFVDGGWLPAHLLALAIQIGHCDLKRSVFPPSERAGLFPD